ncbi:MAG TPA: hypothetical protein PKG95_02490 [Anaerolineaceae bacterium]|jgi:hypothetical protein|nr:hypothetical protein [Anaerolineaceae bacterium]
MRPSRSINRLLLAIFLGFFILQGSVLQPGRSDEPLRRLTRPYEFDFSIWMADAFKIKFAQLALAAPHHLSEAEQTALVKSYLVKVGELKKLKADITWLYSSPAVADPVSAARPLIDDQLALQAELKQLGPLAESILQSQLNAVLLEAGLNPIPPPLYHVTDLPYALIISPREVIRQDYDISLLPDMTMEEITVLEETIERELNVSALIEPVGGIGVYPTMVMATSSITWLPEVVAHEWTHNYLTLHPLGMGYFSSGEMRTINETTASIAGVELSRALLARYYPADLPPEPQPTPATTATVESPTKPAAEPVFSFQLEMHLTRVEVDRLLAAGQIEAAEAYMEERRLFLAEHGYNLRRLNQAYFAFHGAYAGGTGDSAYGAQGQDPVGPAVREFRDQAASLAEFLQKIAWISSFDDLKEAITDP